MRNVRRRHAPGHPVFLTLMCRDRARWLRSRRAKCLVLGVLREIAVDWPFDLHAWVVLDDHLHLIVAAGDGDFSSLVRRFKLRVMRRLRRSRTPIEDRSIWQPRFYDHICRDQYDLDRHIDYVHWNPVKHGVVANAADYAFSSLRAYIRLERRPAGWGSGLMPVTCASLPDKE